jgi:hypothetical protein
MEVENLAIKDDGHTLVFIVEGLVAAGDVNDAQAAHGQCDMPGAVKALTIRPAMGDRSVHCPDNFSRNGAAILLYDTTNSAHSYAPYAV